MAHVFKKMRKFGLRIFRKNKSEAEKKNLLQFENGLPNAYSR